MSEATPPARLSLGVLALLGALTGLLSGLFGVGGGFILVPLLMLLGVNQRLAAGTSAAAILPVSAVGATSYALAGSIDWTAGLLLAAGVVIGAQAGTYALKYAPESVLFWTFVGFLLLVLVSLWVSVPSRDDVIAMSPWTGAALFGVGLVVGVLSGMFGIGGGVVLVPILMFAFGASDLVAKGTSLLMMVPGSISATLANVRRQNVDLRMAAVIGGIAALCAPIGTLGAAQLTPQLSNILFSLLMVIALVQLVIKRLSTKGRA